MVLIKEIELALKPKESNIQGQEDDVLADSVLELANADFTLHDEYQDVTPGTIRKHVEADMRVAYPGKPTSRNRIFKDSTQKDKEYSSSKPDVLTGEDSEVSSENEVSDTISEEELKRPEIDSDVEDESSDFGGSIIGFEDKSKLSETDNEGTADTELANKSIDIFSARARNIEQDIAKGKSIRNQLTIWEKLIECRIKLQPALISVNKLFQCEALKEFKSKLSSGEEDSVYQTYTALGNLMKGLLELQEVALNSSPEYEEIKGVKRKSSDPINNEPEPPDSKKKKGDDLLEKIHDDFKPFRDQTIQKWNEKTRISHGRTSKSDFSAFDQPTLKQIEEILLDRERLLRRTRTKKSDYETLGKRRHLSSNGANDTTDSEIKKVKEHQEYDPEIFDDDDFYHKLLRDFVENKTADSSDVSKRGKQWLELQKLRSRMKAKVDTRASKGRKIRFTVHNKMVNFMAPVPLYTWSDGAKNELFKSLFGQAIVNG